VRDAIVFSGGAWEVFNVPERIALALTRLGIRVLYCEGPVSILHRTRPRVREVEPGIFSFQPYFYGQRLNSFSVFRQAQAVKVAEQILAEAQRLNLNRPIFIYFMLKNFLPLCSALKKDCLLVNVQMDYGQWQSSEHARISDITLAIPRSTYHALAAEFGQKVHPIPQAVDFQLFSSLTSRGGEEPEELRRISRPRLGYLGPAGRQVNRRLLADLMKRHPEWHFISVGNQKTLPLQNVHVLPWQPRETLSVYAAGFDVGFLPYDCANPHPFHGIPLKLLEYFALGLPVVSTPLIELWDLRGLIYLGDTVDELEDAIRNALNEPPDSPKRAQRIEFASGHSIECLAKRLEEVLPLQNG
jgi:hypothetical protein